MQNKGDTMNLCRIRQINACWCKWLSSFYQMHIYINRRSFLPQKTLIINCLKHLIRSPVFNSMTSRHHTMLQCLHLHKLWLEACLVEVVLAQECAGWLIRGDWAVRRWGALRRRELKQSVSGRGGLQFWSTGQYEKTDVFFWALKHVKLC